MSDYDPNYVLKKTYLLVGQKVIVLNDVKPFYVRTYTNKENDFVLILGYECRADKDQVVLNWEHDAYKWITKEEALKFDLTDDGKFFIEHFLSNK